MIAEGDFVFLLGHVSGTHERDLPGLSDGKIVEEWEIFDQAALANQLGR